LASRIFGASPPAGGGQSCPRIAVADGKPPKDILYAERRAAGVGELRHHVATDPAERRAVASFVIAHKRQSLVRQGIGVAEFDQRVTPFLLSLVDLAYPAGSRPYFSRLALDGRTIAAQVGFIENRTLFYYLPAFDAAFRQHSPGHLLLLNLVRDAARLELETVDLLRGQEPYKFKWTSAQQPLSAAEWSVTWRGRAFTLARRFASGQAK
jgi:CelD/BcsL family acetyltransferase involved in cellulose biosynthesis